MIQARGVTLTYDYMGVFTGEGDWIHPKATLSTYELIFVHEGRVYMEEDGKHYLLEKGDVMLLSPHLCHLGYRESGERVSFTWLHFFGEEIEALSLPKHFHPTDPYRFAYRLGELSHLAGQSVEKEYLDAELLSLLYALKYEAMPKGNRLMADAAEYIRTHAGQGVTAEAVAAHFSYSADHLSRAFKRFYGVSLKTYIDRERVALIKRFLLSENEGLDAIAIQCGFEDGNRLAKFFKYHTGHPTGDYRKTFYYTHTNIK